MSILDKIPDQAGFVPNSLNEHFALQLARKLNDLKSIGRYVYLAEHFSQDHLLSVYRRALASPGSDAGEHFFSYLK